MTSPLPNKLGSLVRYRFRLLSRDLQRTMKLRSIPYDQQVGPVTINSVAPTPSLQLEELCFFAICFFFNGFQFFQQIELV